MEKLLKIAKEFLNENLFLNEVELSDGIGKVRVVRNSPVVWYYTQPYTYQYTIPGYNPNQPQP